MCSEQEIPNSAPSGSAQPKPRRPRNIHPSPKSLPVMVLVLLASFVLLLEENLRVDSSLIDFQKLCVALFRELYSKSDGRKMFRAPWFWPLDLPFQSIWGQLEAFCPWCIWHHCDVHHRSHWSSGRSLSLRFFERRKLWRNAQPSDTTVEASSMVLALLRNNFQLEKRFVCALLML